MRRKSSKILTALEFENSALLLVMVSEAQTPRDAGARGRVDPSRECFHDQAAPGSSTETASFAA